MTRDELAHDLALHLLVDPGRYHVVIWREGDEWWWGFGGTVSDRISDEAVVVFWDRLDKGDADPAEIDAYAGELRAWLRTLDDTEFWFEDFRPVAGPIAN